jgi:hypothetical protein
MTLHDGFDRTVSEWLDEQAGRGAPGYLDEILARTTRSRQRPWWSSLERWLPMQTTLRLAPVPRIAWLLVVLGLLVAIGAAVLWAGSRPRLPAPFGPARNGSVVASADGDIYSLDPVTGARTALIADPAFDFGVTFSRDGTKFMFLRTPVSTSSDPGLELVVADADGTGVRVLSPAVQGLDWQDWSPDGSRIAFLSRPTGPDGPGVINVVNVDGSGLRTLDVGRPAHELSWLPPDGKEIVFRGEQPADSNLLPGIFSVRPDGTGLRQISTRPAVDRYDYQDVAVSPDGRRVTYGASGPVFRVHVLDMQTGGDVTLPDPTRRTAQAGGLFSPDGRSIAYQRWNADNTTQLVVAPADGTGTGIAIGPRSRLGNDGPTISNYAFVPDGTALIANYDAEKLTRRLPVDGSPATVVSEGEASFAAYQRLAP